MFPTDVVSGIGHEQHYTVYINVCCTRSLSLVVDTLLQFCYIIQTLVDRMSNFPVTWTHFKTQTYSKNYTSCIDGTGLLLASYHPVA